MANSVIGVLAQRLARKICPNCQARNIVPPAGGAARLNLPDDGTMYYKGKGCSQCFNSGHRGRLGMYEVFEIAPEARRLMEKNVPAGELRELRQAGGGNDAFEEGMLAARAGLTSLEEVLRVAWAPSEEK